MHKITSIILAMLMIATPLSVFSASGSAAPVTVAPLGGGSFGGGDGSPGNPWIIEDVWDLQEMATNWADHYVLGNDIDASVTIGWNGGEGFVPAGTSGTPFTGSLNGNNHTITGLFINRSGQNYIGIFGYMGDIGAASNVRVMGLNVTGGTEVGGIIGRNLGRVNNVHTSGHVAATGMVGSLVGRNEGSGRIGNSTGSGEVKAIGSYVGGLVGLNYGALHECHASSHVNANNIYAGGLVGMSGGGVIVNCSSSGTVLGSGGQAGGLVGYSLSSSTIRGSSSTGNVSSNSNPNVGGLVGLNEGNIFDSHAKGSAAGNGQVGGLVGMSQATGRIENCTASGNAEAVSYVGGLAGYNIGLIFYCGATGHANASNSYAGGFVGFQESGTIFRSSATGNVRAGINYAGGFAGNQHSSTGTISESYSLGSAASVAGGIVGGFIGNMAGNVINCYARGSASGGSNIGGFVGSSGGDTTNCYSTGVPTGTAGVGGFLGDGAGGTYDCFWDSESSGTPVSAAGTPRSTAQMMTQATFVGWDFDNTWYMRNGVMYPVLLWQVAHDPIRINSNADFTPANGVTGGDGTPGNPWIIDGWVIDGAGYGYDIYIGNTTEHFTVRNCYLHNASGGDYSNYFPDSGLVLYNVGNGTIANNIAVGNDWHGIFLYLSGNNAITGNNASNNDRGIRLEQSHGNLVANNTAMYNDQDGLLLYHSESNEVVNNDFFYNQMGIGIYNSATNNITANNLSYNSNGIFFSLASNNILTRNMVSNNNQGFSIQMGCNGNVIYHNRFVSNMFQAIDHGTNFWDNGYPSGGNYWHNYAGIDSHHGPLQNLPGGDGLGDTPYPIGGDGGGIDNYPLMQPWFPDIEPPVANAGPNQDVDEDAEMQFNGTVSADNDGIYNYTWTFTDGGPVAIHGPMPFYTFVQPGNYSVTLTVRDRAGNADTDIMVVNVRDITPPQSDPMLPASADEGQNVLFDGSFSTDNVGIVNYTWNFEDGGPVTLYGMFVNYTFSTPGIHTISLTVWDAAGHWGGGSVPITINDVIAPTANAGPDGESWTGTLYTFNGTGSWDSAGVTNWTWQFVEDGLKTLYGATPTYTFSQVTVFNVTLTVRDQAGFTDSDYVLINVRDGTSPVAHAGWDTTIDMGATAWLSGSWSTDNVDIVNYTWNFTYGSQPITLYGINANYVLSIPGAYVITLTVYDAEGNSDSESIVITVIDTELPVAIAGPDQTVDQGEEFTLDGSGSSDNIGIVNWTWSSQGTWPSPIYGETAKGVFEEAGIYSVILRVYDARGNMAEDTVMITVRDITPPVANAGDNDTVGQGSIITLWAGFSSDNVGIVNYTWTFNYGGNAVILYGYSANHQFDIAGVYVVTLKVMDAAGYWDIDTVTITILDQTLPVAIAGPDQQVTAGTLVTFNGTASTDNVGIVNYTWGFVYGDGYVNLYGAVATFRFNIPGSYIVTLGVMDAALNVATDMITITVTGEEVPIDSFPVTIGPVLDPAGNPIPGATVTLTINGTAYTGVTNATGHAVISIPRNSVGQDAEVEITKDGYDPVSYTTTFSPDGTPATQPPEMEPSTLGPDDQRYDYTWMYIVLILIIVGVIGAALLMKGKGKAPDGAPEEAVPREGETSGETEAEPVDAEAPAPETEDSLDDLKL